MIDRAWAVGPDGWGVYDIEWSSGTPLFHRSATDQAEYVVAPGFVDLHIHGAYGVDFMSGSTDEIQGCFERLAADGYEMLYPTTVTAPVENVRQMIASTPFGEFAPAFHLEGPFISPQFPGAQPKDAILSADRDDGWADILDHDRLRRITLAPEIDGGMALVRKLAEQGVQVSLGHTDATFSQAMQAVQEGAHHATHTFNAMRGFHHRDGGTVGCCLLNDAVCCELIYDRHHVSREATDLLLRTKPTEKVVAVSDCTAAHGIGIGSTFSMWGHDVVTDEDSVRLASDGALAGSVSTLADVFHYLWEDFGAEVAVRLCCINPRLASGEAQTVKTWLLFGPSNNLEQIVRSTNAESFKRP